LNPEKPVFRRLRVFALDPSTAAKMDAAGINEVVLSIPWEELQLGPVGEYVAVVDQDEAGRQLYPPVNLDNPAVLAHDGLTPSDGNPQFHQQMVYAVAMQTIRTFEKALGRQIHWPQPQSGDHYLKQIVIHPHFLDMPNAYYSSDEGAVELGYFEAQTDSQLPGVIVFTCLSQDNVAHELNHAILCTMPFQISGQPNADVFAFHEGFCSLVALLQRFSQPEFLRHQLALTKGDLAGPSQLGILGKQFGEALGKKSGLLSAFGEFDQDGVWHPVKPNPKDYQTIEQPHERGELLLRAVFDALNWIYRARVSDLIRIATEGTGVLPEGELHPDLINRLAHEAAKSASHVLDMCIRALDYCPKADFTFGDYLRAIITADYDLVPNDDRNYRVAFVEAFRRFGIFPADIGTLSIETLLWPKPDPNSPIAKIVQKFMLQMQHDYSGSLPRDREEQYKLMRRWCRKLEAYLHASKSRMRLLTGIDPEQHFVHSIWPCERIGPHGESLSQWVIEIVQANETRQVSRTLLVDADTGLVRYALGTRWKQKSQDILARFNTVTVPPPVERHLRVFASDPSLAVQMETARINQVTLPVPWEKIKEGPVGEYLEVVDYDPATGCFYEPVNLKQKYLIAQDGWAPSQDNPQFHQQMVYAVAMRTIRNFERALGRLALWSPHWQSAGRGKGQQAGPTERFVQRLRLYPHALREANAFYSPEKKAVLFGYFKNTIEASASPVIVFTCLSHDIIAHEMTHALLDGMHHRFAEPSNPDVLAFHEAFADIVALFQHFSLPEVLENQIAATRGDLASQSRLGELAQEFGRAIGNRGALRSAIGEVDQTTGEWRARPPDPEAYVHEMEPHARGSLLVATIFDAFLTIYRSRVADLFRIATKGTGVLPAGRLHPDLVRRLAAEAADSAQGVLEMCIRALDYCPPVDITFGDYLRAIVTADFEFDPIDEHNRRVAFIEAFRRHGILPEGVRTFSLEGLLWQQAKADRGKAEKVVVDFIRGWTKEIKSWSLTGNRKDLFDLMRSKRIALHKFLDNPKIRKSLRSFIDPDLKLEVHALRPSTRIDWQGKSHLQWIIEITQSLPDFLDAAEARALDTRIRKASAGGKEKLRKGKSDYRFRGGATLLVDAETGEVLYSIPKSIDDQQRRKKQREYMSDIANRSLYATYFRGLHEQEPFAALHRF
jgi:hypothetical protein